MSDDGAQALTLIAFVGSVFSPYYAWARRRGRANPLNHCAFNIALYGTGNQRWAMTERIAAQVHREPSTLSIGPSVMRISGNTVEIQVDEICAPLPRRVRGLIRIHTPHWCEHSVVLDRNANHHWSPIAPSARIEVRLSEPALQWNGSAYMDSNRGREPLENAFESWTWSRAALRGGCAVLYDVRMLDGSAHSFAVQIDPSGAVTAFPAPAVVQLGHSKWGIARSTRCALPSRTRVVKSLEDGPFYSRALLDTEILGSTVTAVHESLSLKRFRSPLVQWMLPFRMPRALR